MTGQARILVDHTHLGRTVTGLERITLDLFSSKSLAPLVLEPVVGGSTAKMIAEQQIGLPLRLLRDPRAILLCPGFPPSSGATAFGRRVIPYIHDLFLITRPQDLNWRARHYMVPSFRRAVARLPFFLVNSKTTAAELARFARPDARIACYRPVVGDVFGVAGRAAEAAATRAVSPKGRLDLVAVGTVEPRKNLMAAAAITALLRERHGYDAVLNIVGRHGWGGEAERLSAMPGVVLHGYAEPDRVRDILAGAHVFLSTSHDEGLGLPLIEAQYAGLPVVAPDKPVFREVLAGSGTLMDPADPGAAAERIVALVSEPGVFRAAAEKGAANIARWNADAASDRDALIDDLLAMKTG